MFLRWCFQKTPPQKHHLYRSNRSDKNEKQKRVFVFDFTFSHQTGWKISSINYCEADWTEEVQKPKTKTRFCFSFLSDRLDRPQGIENGKWNSGGDCWALPGLQMLQEVEDTATVWRSSVLHQTKLWGRIMRQGNFFLQPWVCRWFRLSGLKVWCKRWDRLLGLARV